MEAEALPQNRRVSDRWHFGKEIPIVLVLAVLAQTAGGIWWMAQLSSKIDAAVANISEFKTERYTREDARRDRLILDQQFTGGQTADRELERRINSLENRMDRIAK